MPALLWLVLLLIANGFFVAAEFAYITARRNVLEQTSGPSAQIAVKLNRDLSLTLAGAQLGITMASLVLGAVAEPAIAGFLEAGLGLTALPENVIHGIALGIALMIVVFLHMVIGEMAPKNIAISRPERSAVVLALPFRAFMFIFRPLIWLLNGVANGVLRIFGVRPADALDVGHSAEDLAMVIGAGQEEGVIGEFAHNLLTGAIDFTERDVSVAMTPRPDVVAANINEPVSEILEIMKSTGHSRIPVHTGDLDEIRGFVHIKDLIAIDTASLGRSVDPDLIREALAVPEMARIQSVLTEMRRSRSHIGIVVDEHGSTAGIITMEDIAEELVGEITDEHDPEEQTVQVNPDGSIMTTGTLRIEDLAELGVDLPEGEYGTVGGYMMDRLGRVPRRGDLVETDSWKLQVRSTQGRRVGEVAITPLDRA
ncbi:MAG TPA: hemolysin family protein [Acidimicrobiia bacterium]|nr:hemolysin family protein [Acidimicrobiia bacterium]